MSAVRGTIRGICTLGILRFLNRWVVALFGSLLETSYRTTSKIDSCDNDSCMKLDRVCVVLKKSEERFRSLR